MAFIVMVPVLSTHSTLTDPSASITGGRRASTRRRDMRRAPRARNTIRTTGNSSGSIEIDVAMPARRASPQSPRVDPTIPMTAAAAATPMTATIRTIRSISRCNGVRPSSMSDSAVPIRPRPVAAPVASTTPTPRPATTSVPACTHGVPSPPGGPIAGGSSESAATLGTGSDSPDRAASSIWRFTASTSTASAGTRSPSPMSTRSPTTTSRPGILTGSPSRTTRARGELRSRRAASAFSVRRDCTTEIAITNRTATMRITPSKGSASAKLIVPAARRRTSIGSRTTCRTWVTRPRRRDVASSFGPSTPRRRSASADVNPTMPLRGTVIGPAHHGRQRTTTDG